MENNIFDENHDITIVDVEDPVKDSYLNLLNERYSWACLARC